MRALKLWEEQVNNLRKKVDEHVYLTNWKFIQGIENGELPGIDDKKWAVRNSPITWSTKNGTAYLRKLLALPAKIEGISTENSNIDLTFLFLSGVELFIDGKKVYSHKFWSDNIATPFPLMQKAKKGEEHLVVFKTPQGDGFGTFWAKLYINSVENLLFELNSILFQIKFAFKLSEESKHLKRHAVAALNSLNPDDITQRNWDKVLSDIRKAEEILEPCRKYAKKFHVHLIGHAHIDINWLWNYEDTVDVCLRDFETVNRLMDKYPDLTFSQSQAHVYTIVEKADKTLFNKAREKIKKGRWEVTASSWVEGDLNIVDGESIVRHILYSNKYTRE